MKKQWYVGFVALSVFTWMACGPKTLPTDESMPTEETQEQNLNFENNSNNSGNQNNTFDGGVNESTASFDAGVNDDPEPDPTPDPDPEPSNGACDNDADESELADLEATIDDVVQDCALGCLLSGDIGTCGSDCMSENTDLSDGCAGCFGEVIACTAANCAFQCLDANSESCSDCRESNCNDDFEACAGIPAR